MPSRRVRRDAERLLKSRRRVVYPDATGSADSGQLGHGDPVPAGVLYVGCTVRTAFGRLAVVLRLDTTTDRIGGFRTRTYRWAFLQYEDGRRSSVLADTLTLVTAKKEEG